MTMKTNMLLAVGLVAALCLCSVAVMAEGTDAAVDDMFYNDDSTLTYTVLTEDTDTSTGTVSVADGTTTSSGDVTIPLTVTNDSITYTVTEVAASGFAANTAITSVTIPSGVTAVGDSAFSGCTALTTATINNTDGAVTIGTSAFDITPTYAGLTTFTVTFDSNGGSSVDAQTVDYGSVATEPTAPTYEGYTLDGWFTDSDCTVSFAFSTAITADLTLYAGWTAESTDTEDTDDTTTETAETWWNNIVNTVTDFVNGLSVALIICIVVLAACLIITAKWPSKYTAAADVIVGLIALGVSYLGL